MRIEGVNEPQEFFDRIEEVFTILETEDRESDLFKQTREWFLAPENFDHIKDVMEASFHMPNRFEHDPEELMRLDILYKRWMGLNGGVGGSVNDQLFWAGMEAYIDEHEEINEIEDEVERKRRMDEFDSRED